MPVIFARIEEIIDQPTPHELIVTEWGVTIGKHSERIRATKKGEIQSEIPLIDLRQILVMSGGVAISSDVVKECADRGIPIHYIDWAGHPYAALMSAQLTGTVKTRRAQLLAFTDSRSIVLAKAFALGKIANQRNLLRYMNKYQATKDPAVHTAINQGVLDIQSVLLDAERLTGASIDDIRDQLLSCEGRAAHMYWDLIGRLLLAETDWPGRITQGATDLVNSLLNFGYGILCSRVEQAIVLAGLDPYAGFTHTDRPGKPSLVYDLVEEFRQPVVDRTVFAMLNQHRTLALEAGGRLDAPTRKLLATQVLSRMNEGRERYESKKYTLHAILFSQARHVATYVRGDLGHDYTPFMCQW